MLNPSEKSRLKWACRRGMLELDVIFMPFFEHEFDGLGEADDDDVGGGGHRRGGGDFGQGRDGHDGSSSQTGSVPP